MKQTPISRLALALLLTASCGAAFGQAPGAKPAASKKAAPNPALDRYNNAVNHFNRATQDFNAAKNAGNADLLKRADAEVAASATELEGLAQTPDYANDPTIHNLIGYLYLTQDNSASAIPQLQTTVRLKPDNLDARNNLGNALRQQQRYDESAEQYRFVLDHLKPGTTGLNAARIKFNLATVLGQAGKTDEALALFGELAASNPDAATYKNYGFFLQKAGRSAEAADALRKAAEQDPKDAAAWLNAGELYAKGQRYDDAIATLTKAVGPDVDPKLDVVGQYDAYFALGAANAAKSNTNEAIKDFDTAAGLQPQNAVPVYNKGVLQEQAGLKSDAEASYRSALAKDPASVQIQTALGLLLADEGNAAESATLLAQAAPNLTQNAKSALIYARLGDQYAKQKDFAKADQARRQALALNPEDADTRLALADSNMTRRQYVAALAQYDAAAKLRPSDPAIQNGRGLAYKNLKQYPRALQAFQRALALDPSNAQVQNNVGVLYELLGNKAQAVTAYKKALALNPSLEIARRNLSRFARKQDSY
jgi:tetratricopeptide (TPR) repeat protein